MNGVTIIVYRCISGGSLLFFFSLAYQIGNPFSSSRLIGSKQNLQVRCRQHRLCRCPVVLLELTLSLRTEHNLYSEFPSFGQTDLQCGQSLQRVNFVNNDPARMLLSPFGVTRHQPLEQDIEKDSLKWSQGIPGSVDRGNEDPSLTMLRPPGQRNILSAIGSIRQKF